MAQTLISKFSKRGPVQTPEHGPLLALAEIRTSAGPQMKASYLASSLSL
jgi:hypothetical protein